MSAHYTITGPTPFADDWRLDAPCSSADPEIFFPDRGGDPHPAKAICHTCPVRDKCLTTALYHHEEHGVWGGLTAEERRALLRGRPTPALSGRRSKAPASMRAQQVRDLAEQYMTDQEIADRLGVTKNAVLGIRNRNNIVAGLSRPGAPKPQRKWGVKAPAECGTRAGYFRHYRAGEPVCDSCKEAERLYTRERRARKRAKP